MSFELESAATDLVEFSKKGKGRDSKPHVWKRINQPTPLMFKGTGC